MIVGDGKFKFELDQNWPISIPEYWTLGQCADIDIDSDDNAWVFSRGKHPVTKWSNDGKFLGCLLYTSPSPRDVEESRMPSSA